MRQYLSDIVLVCPDNDAESRLILLLAYRLGMTVIRSGQGLGATLERERGSLLGLILATGRPEVWIVEIPGPQIEERLRQAGIEVVIIDHHTYGELDRSRGSSGEVLPSSLEQFLHLTGVDEKQLTTWGYDPIVVHGIAIMDARFVQGLREAGYTHSQICDVLDYREECARAGFPDFDKAQAAAHQAWQERRQINGYTCVVSCATVPIRGAISTITIYRNCDTQPLIVVDKNGAELFVQNVEPAIVERLMAAFPMGFTFGSGRCWGVNNARSRTTCTLDGILNVLS